MDWQLAIERNRALLLRLLTLAFAGVVPGQMVRGDHSALLRLLRPLEAALRRVLFIVAQGMRVRLRSVSGPCQAVIPGTGRAAVPQFALADPLRRPGAPRAVPSPPRISILGFDAPDMRPAAPDVAAMVDAAPLLRRVAAMRAALADIPAAARRVAAWQAKRRQRAIAGRVSPLRTGRPPGHRTRSRHAVDVVLADCHQLALLRMAAPDTS